MISGKLQAEIARCIALKGGNKEFALFFLDPLWSAEIGNPTTCGMLGEVSDEFSGEGTTALEAVCNLRLELEKSQ